MTWKEEDTAGCAGAGAPSCELDPAGGWVRVFSLSIAGMPMYVEVNRAWAVFLCAVDALLPYADVLGRALHEPVLRFLPRRLETLGRADLLDEFRRLRALPEECKGILLCDEGGRRAWRLTQPSFASGWDQLRAIALQREGVRAPAPLSMVEMIQLCEGLDTAVEPGPGGLLSRIWEVALVRAASTPAGETHRIELMGAGRADGPGEGRPPEHDPQTGEVRPLGEASVTSSARLHPAGDRGDIAVRGDTQPTTVGPDVTDGPDVTAGLGMATATDPAEWGEPDVAGVEGGVDAAPRHAQFSKVLHCVRNDVPAMLVGPAGSGKNYLAKQVADELGLAFRYANSVTDEFKITGFIDAGGTYHQSEFYRAFTQGGLFFLDELDASAPEVLVCLNAAISNRYFAFPTGYEEAHPDFRVLAAGNTLGTNGSALYTGRTRLDAASLDRFVVIEVGYDRRIDLLCAGGDRELVAFFEAYRAAFAEMGMPVVASYRSERQIKAMQPVMGDEEALRSCLLRGLGADEIHRVTSSLPIRRLASGGSNRWVDALARIERRGLEAAGMGWAGVACDGDGGRRGPGRAGEWCDPGRVDGGRA